MKDATSELLAPDTTSGEKSTAGARDFLTASEHQLNQPVGKLIAPQQDPGKPITVLLIAGRSGAGKTSFIKTACTDHVTEEPLNATNEPTCEIATIGRHTFKLIDTPGFDNPAIGNYAVWAKVANYLLRRGKDEVRVAGVIYLHRATDPLKSRVLQQNLGLLLNVFLGKSGLPRLKIVVVSERPTKDHPSSAAQELLQTAIIRSAYSKGVRVFTSNLNKNEVQGLMTTYVAQEPILLQIQEDYIHNPQIDIGAQIVNELVRSERAITERLLSPYNEKIRSLETQLIQKESQVSELSQTNQEVNRSLAQTQKEASDLRQQYRQTQKEYASLRSQLQLQENTEQGEIVQSLKDLNRMIDDIGHSISEYLVDNHIQLTPRQQLRDVTALDARHLSELMKLMGHAEKRSSLVASYTGVGMPIEDFFDYATRMLLCKFLCHHIFHPFHPSTDPSFSRALADMYGDVQRRDPQLAAAKWRSESFKSISKLNESTTTGYINDTVKNLLDYISLPVKYFFGRESNIRLPDQQSNRLAELIQVAWKWNSVLKGQVIVLGDFCQTFYPPLGKFDSSLMEQFEPNSGSLEPKFILGTIGLGLSVSQAIGGNKTPVTTQVVKAVVATRSLYAKG